MKKEQVPKVLTKATTPTASHGESAGIPYTPLKADLILNTKKLSVAYVIRYAAIYTIREIQVRQR